MSNYIKVKQLIKMQNWSLEEKEFQSLERIKLWHDYWGSNVYVSFSGGKDSTVLLNLVRKIYPDVPGVFVNTGLEYPEICQFVKTLDNIIQIRPEMPFYKVIEKYGYPIVSKAVSQKINEIRNTKSDKLRNLRLFGPGISKLAEKWKFLIKEDFKISDKCCHVLKKNLSTNMQKKQEEFLLLVQWLLIVINVKFNI